MQFIYRTRNATKAALYDGAGRFKLSIVQHPLFIIGLVVKLYAATLFASTYFTHSFVPFVKYFLTTGNNPYHYFFTEGFLTVFPYPQLMLWIMAVPGSLFLPFLHPDFGVVGPAELLLFHLPILAGDILILLILSRWLQNRSTELLWLYWLSPVLLYISYIHSQLDVIPIALVFLFLHLLCRERWTLAYIVLGAAIATKFHIIILVPFLAVYLWRHHLPPHQLIGGPALALSVFLAINAPVLFTEPFRSIVLFNPEQAKVFDLVLPLADHLIYIVPAAYLILFLHSLTFKRFSRDTYVMFLGFSFGLLTLLIPPMPGWYYWVIPFFIYFYVRHEQYARTHLLLLSAAYFLYFAVSADSDFLSVWERTVPSLAALPPIYEVLERNGFDADFFENLALTILQATLLINVLWLYRRGVEDSRKRKLFTMPYLIGIAGDSGSGKSTLADLLAHVLGTNHVAIVPGDAMHKWERGDERWQQFTHLNPNANLLHEDIENVQRLKTGDTVYRRHYDHRTGTFTVPEKLHSKKLVIFEGLHSLYLTYMQQALDLKIFIAPEEQLRIHWKLVRDIHHRGYTRERVLNQLAARESDSAQYIATQARNADLIISLRSETDLAPILGTDTPIETFLELTCNNTVNVERFITALQSWVRIEHSINERHHVLQIAGTISATQIQQISYELLPDLYDIVVQSPRWDNDYNGIMQLFIMYYVFETLRLSPHAS